MSHPVSRITWSPGTRPSSPSPRCVRLTSTGRIGWLRRSTTPPLPSCSRSDRHPRSALSRSPVEPVPSRAARLRWGRGPNRFSGQPEAVFVDGSVSLLPNVVDHDGRRHCTDVDLDRVLGHGTCVFRLAGRIGELGPNAVLGLFVHDLGSAHYYREIGIEAPRWGIPEQPAGNAPFRWLALGVRRATCTASGSPRKRIPRHRASGARMKRRRSRAPAGTRGFVRFPPTVPRRGATTVLKFHPPPRNTWAWTVGCSTGCHRPMATLSSCWWSRSRPARRPGLERLRRRPPSEALLDGRVRLFPGTPV